MAVESRVRSTKLQAPLPGMRVLLQNIWARAARESPCALQALTALVSDLSLPEGFAACCVAVAAQLLLHPAHGGNLCSLNSAKAQNETVLLDESDELRPLLQALVGWSTSYVHGPRLMASVALYHALERSLIQSPGWYLEALRRSLADCAVFQKFRQHVQMDKWISNAWESLQHPDVRRPLDVAVSVAQKRLSDQFWKTTVERDASTAGSYQRRPNANHSVSPPDVVVVGSLLDNMPNMAGLVRTTEALLGSHGEVTLHTEKILRDPSFLKISVAAEKAGRVTVVPEGHRLIAYVREKKAHGFTVVALEQTSTSKMLEASTKLPERLVLLVGNEQEGLPAWLVQSGLVDRFLELPLLGQTGSLNAHVATSMILWQYCLQHRPS
eukprot:gnl/MRDRNA2_/MRDRNA2_282979_c0_seq1.p1 gnl/MRDRNA2_/MRDRNA2_282979_c0~~gnl/MRDRNA2_/MRDRNA2_282979_c0_seq1.p1  ORF type:complete len:411 (+),score=53.46 gnl/MRDRNA2_/MRDRNA2_282979_c0_seq1:87-1235(+)